SDWGTVRISGLRVTPFHCLVAVMALVAAALSSANPAVAQCATGVPDDRTIVTCTIVIESGRESDHNLAIDFAIRANAYRARGELYRAIADYDETIRLNPTDANALKNRGNVYFERKDYDHAIADYDAAIRLDPKFAFAFNNRGNAYKAKGDLNRAIADYDAAIRLDPNYAAALYWRGKVKKLKGDNRGGDADITAAKKIDPKIGS